MRSGMPGELERFVAYAGSAIIAVAGYGRLGTARIISSFWMCAATLEYLQHFSPGRHPSVADFAASAVAASFGGAPRNRPRACPWACTYTDV